jgi:hypothetical protein
LTGRTHVRGPSSRTKSYHVTGIRSRGQPEQTGYQLVNAYG